MFDVLGIVCTEKLFFGKLLERESTFWESILSEPTLCRGSPFFDDPHKMQLTKRSFDFGTTLLNLLHDDFSGQAKHITNNFRLSALT